MSVATSDILAVCEPTKAKPDIYSITLRMAATTRGPGTKGSGLALAVTSLKQTDREQMNRQTSTQGSSDQEQ